MRVLAAAVPPMLLVLSLAGCAAPPPPPVNDGFLHISRSGTFDCAGQPVAFDGGHADVTLQNDCPRVRVAGSHNDITVYVVPGAVIEVTGGHNTVVYRLLRRGGPPRWVNLGDSNELVRNSRAPWQRDHDFYDEHG